MYFKLITIILNFFVLQTHFLVSCIFLGYFLFFMFSMSLRIVHFCFLFVYVVPQSSMDDGFCNSSL